MGINSSSKQINHQPFNGVISYTANYVAVSGTFLVPGAIEEEVEILDNGFSDVFASIPIPGKINGPIIQGMRTSTAMKER